MTLRTDFPPRRQEDSLLYRLLFIGAAAALGFTLFAAGLFVGLAH